MRARVVLYIALLLGQVIIPGLAPAASADAASSVLISELQVAGTMSASDEFVELYNASPEPVDIAKLSLEYRSASSSAGADCAAGWIKKATVATGTIPGYGFYLLRATGFGAGDSTFNAGLAGAGTIRLVDTNTTVVDTLAWGNSQCGAGAAAAAPTAGHSLERRAGADNETGGNAYDTANNAADFMPRAVPGPQSLASAAEIPVENYVPSAPVVGGLGNAGGDSAGAAQIQGAGTAAPIELNELLPDPASPLTDTKDEFIEFYNPTDAPVSLSGYVIKSGLTLSTKHTLPDVTIGATSYLVLKSGDTKIALANDGSSVALFGPDGVQIGVTVSYVKAKTGIAWARFDNSWAWTNTPTPGAANIISEPAASAAATSKSASASKSTKKASTTTKSTKTTKAAATKKAKAAKISAAPVSAGATTTGGRWLLFALAGLTIGYIIYEFRYDVRNFYDRLRGHAKPREAALAAASGRRGHRTGK